MRVTWLSNAGMLSVVVRKAHTASTGRSILMDSSTVGMASRSRTTTVPTAQSAPAHRHTATTRPDYPPRLRFRSVSPSPAGYRVPDLQARPAAVVAVGRCCRMSATAVAVTVLIGLMGLVIVACVVTWLAGQARERRADVEWHQAMGGSAEERERWIASGPREGRA